MVSKNGFTKTPRKSSNSTIKGKKKVEFMGYVNWTLTEAHKVSFNKWLETNPDINDLIYKITESGYSLKIAHDDYNHCMSASLYCMDVASANAGWNLSMRANDWEKAIERLVFVHLVAFDTMWQTDHEKAWEDDAW